MTRFAFNKLLHGKLSDLPAEERKRWEEYYNEMLDDKMEDGVPEEDAVEALGPVNEIASRITEDYENSLPEEERKKRHKKTSPWIIVLLVFASPILLSVGLALLAVILTLYILLWVLVISFYCVPVCFIGGGIVGCIAAFTLFASGRTLLGISFIGVVLVCVGLTFISFIICNWYARLVIRLTRFIFRGILKRGE